MAGQHRTSGSGTSRHKNPTLGWFALCPTVPQTEQCAVGLFGAYLPEGDGSKGELLGGLLLGEPRVSPRIDGLWGDRETRRPRRPGASRGTTRPGPAQGANRPQAAKHARRGAIPYVHEILPNHVARVAFRR